MAKKILCASSTDPMRRFVQVGCCAGGCHSALRCDQSKSIEGKAISDAGVPRRRGTGLGIAWEGYSWENNVVGDHGKEIEATRAGGKKGESWADCSPNPRNDTDCGRGKGVDMGEEERAIDSDVADSLNP
jgi:hypothetical protein